MHKAFIVALALIGFGALSPALAKAPTVESICHYAWERCITNCDSRDGACYGFCDKGVGLCRKNGAQIQIRGFSKGSSKGNLKDFPVDGGGKLKAHGASSAGAMSTMQGRATAPTPAVISTTNGSAVTNSGTISTNSGAVTNSGGTNNGSAVTNTGVIISRRGGAAAGGSGLFSRPSTPRLRAQ